MAQQTRFTILVTLPASVLLLVLAGCSSTPEKEDTGPAAVSCGTPAGVAYGSNTNHNAQDLHAKCPDPLPPLNSATSTNRTGKLYFTSGLRSQYLLNEDQMQNLQYYNSRRIVMYRELAGADQYVAQGRLVTRNGRHFDEVIIEQETPGVVTNVGEHWVSVDFGQNSEFIFGTPKPGTYNPRDLRSQQYRLWGYGWQGNKGKIRYGDKVYNLVGSSANSALLVNRDVVSKGSKQRTILPGRRIGDTPENSGYSYPTYDSYTPPPQ